MCSVIHPLSTGLLSLMPSAELVIHIDTILDDERLLPPVPLLALAAVTVAAPEVPPRGRLTKAEAAVLAAGGADGGLPEGSSAVAELLAPRGRLAKLDEVVTLSSAKVASGAGAEPAGGPPRGRLAKAEAPSLFSAAKLTNDLWRPRELELEEGRSEVGWSRGCGGGVCGL